MIFLKSARFVCLLCILATSCLWAQQSSTPSNSDTVSTDQLSKDITAFLGREIGAHVADIHSFNPPQDRVVGVPTTGDFDWGTFTRAVASYAALSGEKTIGGREVTYLIGQGGLIEARQGGKTFAQLPRPPPFPTFRTPLKTTPLCPPITPEPPPQH